ncbi:protein FRA10AC1 homolog [Anthonomus grandis grandis]|uniref:protein FRA10AC1 homolog n=1 Tax=Anthonomus grandis grandis TaxID=2921223 RepID=UPI0021664886|nr:protein FRA10AC1 homolog [Anthonomus grandis grandis]
MTDLRTQMRYLNAYDIHKLLVNEYVLKRPGDTKLLQRDKTKDRTDYHVLKDNHKFLWGDKEPQTWEEQFAKKYYEKLFKEYCIADLSRYKENKVALRWRIEREVVSGKGQFICGNKICEEKDDLRSWEVNFGYVEQGEKKNALVKIRLCPSCSKKLNYHSKKREVKRLKKKTRIKEKDSSGKLIDTGHTIVTSEVSKEVDEPSSSSSMVPEESPWDAHKPEEVRTREEEMEDYLQDLLM